MVRCEPGVTKEMIETKEKRKSPKTKQKEEEKKWKWKLERTKQKQHEKKIEGQCQHHTATHDLFEGKQPSWTSFARWWWFSMRVTMKMTAMLKWWQWKGEKKNLTGDPSDWDNKMVPTNRCCNKRNTCESWRRSVSAAENWNLCRGVAQVTLCGSKSLLNSMWSLCTCKNITTAN